MRKSALTTGILFAVDAALVNLGYYGAFFLKFGADIPRFNFVAYVRLMPYISALVLLIFLMFDLYEIMWKRPLEILRSTIYAVASLGVCTMGLAFVLRGFSFPRMVFVLAAVLHAILLASWRYIWMLSVNKSTNLHHVLLIGPDPAGRDESLQKALASTIGGRITVLALAEDLNDTSVTEAVATSVDREAFQAVFIEPTLPLPIKKKVICACLEKKSDVFIIPEFYDILLNNVHINKIDDYPVLHVGGLSLSTGQRLAKRTFDLALALLGIAIALPVMLVIAPAIAISSPGSIFYRQERVGFLGKKFWLIKFRSMKVNAEEGTGPVLAVKKDPRTTGFGRFLRVTHLDELPQLLNVLRGEMSFVGPRPERPFFTEQFIREMPEYTYRHMVKPGITGLAQVRGGYDTDPANKLRFDLYYIRNCSLLLDLQIILQTIGLVLFPRKGQGMGALKPAWPS